MSQRLSGSDNPGCRAGRLCHQGNPTIAPAVAVSRSARSGKCLAKVAGRAGSKRKHFASRAEPANDQIARRNRRRGASAIERKAQRSWRKVAGCDAMETVESRWLHVAGRQYGELLLIRAELL